MENIGLLYGKQLIWSALQNLSLLSSLSFLFAKHTEMRRANERSAPHRPLLSWGDAVDSLTNTNR